METSSPEPEIRSAANRTIFPVGILNKNGIEVFIEIYPEYTDGLLGLNQFSHILVFYWFHKNDTPEKRRTHQVHPRGNRANPLTGVFATRSPRRPNPIGVSICNVLSVDGNMIRIDQIDAFDESLVIDIKPYFPWLDSTQKAKIPEWAKSES